MEKTAVNKDSETLFAVVNNIPSCYHSADLRKFFSQFLELKGFECFHFRHRPERQSVKSSVLSSESETQTNQLKEPKTGDITTYCCIIKIKETRFVELIRTYHERHWQDKKGESMPIRCLISRLKTSSTEQPVNLEPKTLASAYLTRGEKKNPPPDGEIFREEDLLKLPELRPPSVMPNGNVGTPTMYFMRLISECRLPASIIKKLQLDFPKSKGRGKYGTVPFDYPTDIRLIGSDINCEVSSVSASPSVLLVLGEPKEDHRTVDSAEVTVNTSSKAETDLQNTDDNEAEKIEEPDYKKLRQQKKLARRATKRLMEENIEEKMIAFEKGGSDSDEDNDMCEEWERHEAMYDDVTSQERTKERLFEEEMEIVWEKGGSGLVFYTDAQYWQEKDGDFDEQTTDDLDIDMSVYYEKGAGDKDILDFVDIRQEQRRRRGAEQTDRFTIGIGKFERHTKGFGRKILEKQGWKDGCGLGSSVQGMADALKNEGQHPHDRKGFGYRGEKLVRYAPKMRKDERRVLISTVYDSPSQTDPPETLLRRNDLSYIKHRDRIN